MHRLILGMLAVVVGLGGAARSAAAGVIDTLCALEYEERYWMRRVAA